MLTEIPELGEYLDVQESERVWRPGTVVEIDASKGYRVEYLRSDSKFAEWFDVSSPRLSPYRLKTKCSDSQEFVSVSVTKEGIEEMQKYVRDAQEKMFEYQGSKGIVRFFRGTLYNFATSLLHDGVSSRPQFESAIAFLLDIISLAGVWAQRFSELVAELAILQTRPDRMYECESAAIASCYPEFFRILSHLLGSSTTVVRFMNVILTQNSYVSPFCKEQRIASLEEYFWREGFDGKFLTQVVGGFSGEMVGENLRAAMCVLEQMPFWEYVSNHRQELAQGSVFGDILSLIYQKLLSDTHDYPEFTDIQKLWQLVLSTSQMIQLLGYPEYVTEIIKAFLSLVSKLTQSTSLEKRVAVMNLLQILGQKAESDETMEFAQVLSQWTMESGVCFLMLNDPHIEVLKRGREFWKWLQCNRLFPIECLQKMVQSTIGAHESYRESMYDLIIAISQHFREPEFTVLQQEMSEEFDAQSLKFVKRLIEKFDLSDAKAKQFAENMLEKVRKLIFDQQSGGEIIEAAVQTHAELMRIPYFRSHAPRFFQEIVSLFFDNETSVSAQVLVLLLNNFKEDNQVLTRILTEFRTKRGYSFISGLQKCILQSFQNPSHSWKSTQASSLLACMDMIGCATYNIQTRQCQITRDELLEVFTTVCTASVDNAGIQEDMFKFLEDCAHSSPWFSPDFALHLLRWLVSQPAVGFVQQLTISEFEHIYELLIHANDDTFEKEHETFCFVKGTHIYGFVELVYLAVNVTDVEVHEVATYHINKLLTRVHKVANAPFIAAFLRTIFENVSRNDPVVTVRCFMCLKSVIEYEVKYRELLWDEAELQTRVEECLKDIKIESQFREEAEVFLKNRLVEIAVQMNVQYNQIKFVIPQKQNGPLDLTIMELPYVGADVAYLIDDEKYTQLLLGSLSCNRLKIHELVWWIVDKLVGKSKRCKNIEKLGSEYSDCLKGKLDSRILNLKALLELSKNYSFIEKYRSKRMDLFAQLKKISENGAKASIEAISSHRQRVLLHFEVLFSLIDIHFVQQKNFLSTPQLAEALICLTVISYYYSHPDTDKSYRSLLMQNIGDLMVTTLSVSHEAEEPSKKFDFPALCQSALIESESEHFSEAAAALLWRICETKPTFVGYFAQILVCLQDEAMKKWEKTVSYFDLLGNLLKVEKLEQTADSDRLKISVCCLMQNSSGILTSKLWTVIEGLSNLLTEEDINAVAQESLYQLFTYPTSHPRYADFRHRKANLSCLKAICMQFPTIVDSIIEYLDNFHVYPTWRKVENWSISLNPVESGAYRGLKNQGATCYMNSTFQQLFAIDSFLSAILSIEASEFPLLTDFQRIMSHLKFNSSGVVSAEGILYSLKHTPIDPMEQNDIVEFFEELMKRLEEDLGPGREEVINDVFRGRTMRTIMGKGGCTHVRHSPESFLTFPLEVKNKRHLLASLESTIKTELFAGDSMLECDKCEQKVISETTNRLYHLPNVLIISLRRFYYSMEEGKKFKINDKFEFPLSLNLKNVSFEQPLPNDYYEYELKGVVIHVGTAEAGHYYSLINRGGVWSKFDDTVVTQFDIADMPKEAFGGRIRSAHMNVDKSAYLLIYSRASFYKYPLDINQEIVPMDLGNDRNLSQMVEEIKQQSEGEQSTQLLLRQLMSVEYVNFVGDMISLSSISTLKFALSYFFTIHCRRSNWLTSKDFLRPLMTAFSQTPSIAYWMFEVLTVDPLLNELLLTAPLPTKKSFVILFATAVTSASDSASCLLLTRLINKMERLDKVDSVSYAQLFELMHYVVLAIPNIAVDLKLCERLIARLVFNMMGEVPEPLQEKGMIYAPEVYLGYLHDEYSTLPKPSKETNIAFQLLIINDLKAQNPNCWRLFQENVQSIESDFILSKTNFEQKNAIELLENGDFDTSALIARICISYCEVTKGTESRFLSFVSEILKRKDPSLLHSMLSILLENELPQESKVWYWLLLQTYANFPTASEWRNPDILTEIQSRMLRLGLEAKVATVLEGLRAGMQVQQIPAKNFAVYNSHIPANTKILLDSTDKGKVIDSFDIVHVVKMDKGGDPRWIPSEYDIELP